MDLTDKGDDMIVIQWSKTQIMSLLILMYVGILYIIEGNRIIKKKADYPYLLFYPFHLFPLLKSKVDKWIISITCYQYNAKRQKEHTPHKFR